MTALEDHVQVDERGHAQVQRSPDEARAVSTWPADHDVDNSRLELEITNSTHPYADAEVQAFALDYEQFQAALYDLHNRRRDAEANGEFELARKTWLSVAKLKQDVEAARRQIAALQMESEKARLDETRIQMLDELSRRWDDKEQMLKDEIEAAFVNLETKWQEEAHELDMKYENSAMSFKPSPKLLSLQRRMSALIWLQQYDEAKLCEVEYHKAETSERGKYLDKCKIQTNILRQSLRQKQQEEKKDMEANKWRLLEEFQVARTKALNEAQSQYDTNVSQLKTSVRIKCARLKPEVELVRSRGGRVGGRSSPIKDTLLSTTPATRPSTAPRRPLSSQRAMPGRAVSPQPIAIGTNNGRLGPQPGYRRANTTPSRYMSPPRVALLKTRATPSTPTAETKPNSRQIHKPVRRVPDATAPRTSQHRPTTAPTSRQQPRAQPARVAVTRGRTPTSARRIDSSTMARTASPKAALTSERADASRQPLRRINRATESETADSSDGTEFKTAYLDLPQPAARVHKPSALKDPSVQHDSAPAAGAKPTDSNPNGRGGGTKLIESVSAKQLEWIDCCIKIGNELTQKLH